MNLLNKKVTHKVFGKGNVVSQNKEYIKIEFESGVKKFVFPDVFGKFMTLSDDKASKLVRKKIQKQDEIREQEILLRQKEKVLKEEKRRLAAQKKMVKKPKSHPKLQSVFWCKDQEEEKVFEEWKVFVGTIKNGTKKGQPRKLSRMNEKSGCLLTKREPDMPEKKRRILGVFMAAEDFNGQSCEDGYIPAHTDYRIRLSEEESEKMLFWNYYINKKFPKTKTWNSGRQRYFENIWMAQILQDIIALKTDPEEQKYVKHFLQYFCRVNRIHKEEIPEANGALIHQS